MKKAIIAATVLSAIALIGAEVKYNLWNCDDGVRSILGLGGTDKTASLVFTPGQIGEIVRVTPFWGLQFESEEQGCEVLIRQFRDASSQAQPLDIKLEWSRNAVSWGRIDIDRFNLIYRIPITNVGDRLCIRAADHNNAFGTMDTYCKFSISKRCKCSGNVMSLLYREEADSVGSGNSMGDYAFKRLFYGCNITSAPTLPSTTLSKGCYQSMFGNCAYLKSAPLLPATNLADNCYWYMFYGSGITSAVLPATTLADGCYEGMFYGCSSLLWIDTKMNSFATGTSRWVESVRAGGTFYCRSQLDDSVRGNNTIPQSWNVVRKYDD